MKDWSFVFVTDIHVGSSRSFRYEPSWNENWKNARKKIIDIDPDFLLVGGDITRDGNVHKYELKSIKEDLDSLPFPYHVLPGNMDTGNKYTDVSGPRKERDDTELNISPDRLQNYIEVFGDLWWSFDHKGVRFSGFCDMLLGSGLSKEEELENWLELQTERSPLETQVWVTHSPPFVESPNEPTFEITNPSQYLSWYYNINKPERQKLFKVFEATNTKLVLSGHVHCRKIFSAKGITFYIGPSTAFSQWEEHWKDGDPRLGFVKFVVEGKEFKDTFIPLDKTSNLSGYGPGGHPDAKKHEE